MEPIPKPRQLKVREGNKEMEVIIPDTGDKGEMDYLEEAEAEFYIGKRQHKDFQFHQRQMPEIRFFRDEENLGYKASINLRCGIFIKNWRAWGRAGGTYA